MTATKDGVSAEVLRRQLMGANMRLEVVAAQLAALRAKEIKDDPSQLSILERVAFALAQASEAARAQQSVPLDPAGHHTPHPNDRAIPGSSTRRARYQKEKLERHLEDALDLWEQAKENDFMPVSKNKAPRVRCRRRACPRHEKWVPAWDVNGVSNEFCTGCGERLPAPDESEKGRVA